MFNTNQIAKSPMALVKAYAEAVGVWEYSDKVVFDCEKAANDVERTRDELQVALYALIAKAEA
jgi:hypothetical protein